jgi:hypothetical protein
MVKSGAHCGIVFTRPVKQMQRLCVEMGLCVLIHMYDRQHVLQYWCAVLLSSGWVPRYCCSARAVAAGACGDHRARHIFAEFFLLSEKPVL